MCLQVLNFCSSEIAAEWFCLSVDPALANFNRLLSRALFSRWTQPSCHSLVVFSAVFALTSDLFSMEQIERRKEIKNSNDLLELLICEETVTLVKVVPSGLKEEKKKKKTCKIFLKWKSMHKSLLMQPCEVFCPAGNKSLSSPSSNGFCESGLSHALLSACQPW